MGDASTLLADADLVIGAQRGDQASFGVLYERYFDPVYDYLVRLTRSRELAADVAQDTFIRAMQKIGQLEEPAAFKGWIYRIARSQALNRLEREARSVATAPVEDDEAPLNPLLIEIDHDRLSSPAVAAEVEECAALVWEAAEGLDERTYTVLDLTVRHGLDSAEIAEVMGVTSGNAYTMVSRMKDRVETVIGAYVMARKADHDCPDLRAVIGRAELPPMTPTLAKAVTKHVDGCEVCDPTRRRLVSPANVFAAFAAVAAPAGLAGEVWEEIESRWDAEGPQPPTKSFLRRGALIGAALVVALVVAVVNAEPIAEPGPEAGGVDVLSQQIDQGSVVTNTSQPGSDPAPEGLADSTTTTATTVSDDPNAADTTTTTDVSSDGSDTTTTTTQPTTTTTTAGTTTTTTQPTTTTTTAPPTNEPPTAAITVPRAGPAVCAGTAITFVGEADDPDGDDLDLEWSSSIDGVFGTGTQATLAPSAGVHTVTFEATDPAGESGTDTIRVDARECEPPLIEILAPLDGSHFSTQAPTVTVRFVANVFDDVDTDLEVT